MDTKKFFKLAREYCENGIDEENSHSCVDNGCGLCGYCYKEMPSFDSNVISAAIRTLEEWDAERRNAEKGVAR